MTIFDQLCAQKNRAVALCKVLFIIILLLGIVITALVVKIGRLQDREYNYLKSRNSVRQETNLLCRVNGNLTGILSMELKNWKGDWEEDVSEVCR
jgi:hypothetical protein